jgi:hypothetical protein
VNLKRVGDRVLGALRRRSDTERLIPALISDLPHCHKNPSIDDSADEAELSGHQLIIRRADLGAAGIYYRALVGPFASAEKATRMCSALKAAGGDCIIQKN